MTVLSPCTLPWRAGGWIALPAIGHLSGESSISNVLDAFHSGKVLHTSSKFFIKIGSMLPATMLQLCCAHTKRSFLDISFGIRKEMSFLAVLSLAEVQTARVKCASRKVKKWIRWSLGTIGVLAMQMGDGRFIKCGYISSLDCRIRWHRMPLRSRTMRGLTWMVDGIGSAGKQQAVTTRINESGLRRSSSISTDPVFTAFVAVLSKCSKGVSGYFLFSFFLESNLFSALVGTLDFSISFSMSLTSLSSTRSSLNAPWCSSGRNQVCW